MLSKYCSDVANKYELKVGRVNKLVSSLRDKIRYVVHYKNLQHYLSLGMKLIKVHRISKFKQSNWLKKYIEFNTYKRKNAVSALGKNLFKPLISCIYGKSLENIRKRISVKLINNSKDYLRCVSKPNFISQNIFDKNFIAVHQTKSVLTLNKPIHVGFSILELSKLLMYKFHYDYVRNKYDAKLLFTDTDRLVYEKNGNNNEKNRLSRKDSLPTDKSNKSIYILVDNMVKHVEGWKFKKSIQKSHNVYVRDFSRAKVKRIQDFIKSCICEKNPDNVIFHVGTTELNSQLPLEGITKSIIDVAKNTQSDSRIVSKSGIVSRSDNFNIKAIEAKKELSKRCDKEKFFFFIHSNINSKTYLNKSKLHLNRKPGKNYVDFVRNNLT